MQKMRKMKRFKRFVWLSAIALVLCAIFATGAGAVGISVDFSGIETTGGMADTIQILLLLTIIALAPSILVMMTGFTRIVIVLSFVRNAMGLQNTPPNQVIISLALFLTFFLMAPIFGQMYDEAYQPYVAEEITLEQALDAASVPLKRFMLAQTYTTDMDMFLSLSGTPAPGDTMDIPITTVIPAFITSELKRAFIIGFFIYIPFLIIDIVVSSTLMSMGMMMLPPAMVSMPFKIIMFIIVDGWGLIIRTLFISFG